MRILIIEDEYKLAEAISSRLKIEKYNVDCAIDGQTGLDLSLTNAYDLIILDIMLPIYDGFEILKQVRNNNIDSKIIILSAKYMIEDKLKGLNNGADDYITKPFYMDELIARIDIQLNKNNKNKSYIEVGDIILDKKKLCITCTKTKETIDIVGKEYQLIQYFMCNPNQIIEKEQFYNKIWGLTNEIESNNLEAYLSFIRKKLNIIGSTIKIKAVRNIGYKLEVDDEKIKT